MTEITATPQGFNISFQETLFNFNSSVIPKAENGNFVLTVSGKIPVPQILPKDRLLLPIDEGVAIAADKDYECGEFDINNIRGSFCSRQGTMGMIIIQRNNKYLAIILDSTAGAEYYVAKKDGIYSLEMFSRREKKVTYALFNNLVSACKFYRSTRKTEFISLSEKIKHNPEIKKLCGGGIFWIWNDNYDEIMYSDKDTDAVPNTGKKILSVAEDLHQNGIKNALFGIFFKGDSEYVETLYKKYGYICTQYDNYNDVLNPALLNIVPKNRIKNCDYTFRRMKDFPDGIIRTQNGNLAKAWALRGFDGEMHDQNALCCAVAAKRMNLEIPEVLKEYPYYKGRFIDVFGNGLSECFDKNHPVTLEESQKIKRQAFADIKNMGLITGTEDLIEEIMDNLDYSEGLHSPVYLRIKDAGRKHAHIYTKEQEKHIGKHMMSPECRVPLWQLAYHECVAAFPYWGDSTEMAPSLVKEKILFAVLYGCAPLYSFSLGDYEKLKPSILESYQKITAVHQKVATLPMTDFEVISDNFELQRSVFGEKYQVIANFGNSEAQYGNVTIPAKDFVFTDFQKSNK